MAHCNLVSRRYAYTLTRYVRSHFNPDVVVQHPEVVLVLQLALSETTKYVLKFCIAYLYYKL